MPDLLEGMKTVRTAEYQTVETRGRRGLVDFGSMLGIGSAAGSGV
jgi:hypothetical protein